MEKDDCLSEVNERINLIQRRLMVGKKVEARINELMIISNDILRISKIECEMVDELMKKVNNMDLRIDEEDFHFYG